MDFYSPFYFDSPASAASKVSINLVKRRYQHGRKCAY